MADTGLRVSDALALRGHDIAPKMQVQEGKTGKIRTVRLAPRTLALARQRAAGRPPDVPLVTCDRSTIYRDIRQAATAIGLRNVSAHSVRKYYAHKYCARHGLLATQVEMQHRDTLTTMIYVTDYDRLMELIP